MYIITFLFNLNNFLNDVEVLNFYCLIFGIYSHQREIKQLN